MSGDHVDILLATCDGERYLAEQIDSLLAQSHSAWTLWIRDDGSRDRTPQIAEDYARRHPERIRLVEGDRRNLGPAGNFEELMKLSLAPYAMFCDQDDVWLRHKVEASVFRIREMESLWGDAPLLAHSDLEVVDQDLRTIAPSFWKYQNLRPSSEFRRLLLQNSVTGCAAIFNRRLAEISRPFPPKIIMHDWWIALVASAFGRVDWIEEPSIRYRQHGGNRLGAQAWGIRHIAARALRPNFGRRLRESLQATQYQARSFRERYGHRLNAEEDEMLRVYASLSERNFLSRRAALLRYGLWKNGLARNLGLLAAI